jgi:hypothetical protein
MTITDVIQLADACVYTAFAGFIARGARRHVRGRNRLADLERERWARLVAGDVSDAGNLAEPAVQVLTEQECKAVAAYIVVDICARWPPTEDDLRKVAAVAGESEIYGCLTDAAFEARSVAARLVTAFHPPDCLPRAYIARILAATGRAEDTGADLASDLLPALLLRRGPNDRAIPECSR